jgi:putative nucleotidyltransferase with HDIG domain
VRATKGALLHDVGKLAVPDHILGKPGPLTPEERTEMEQHVGYGLEIVSQSHFLQEAALVVGGHHEHYDGTGYPSGLKGEAIPREGRLFALVDVFDALTSVRVYKLALGIEEALAIMAGGRGAHFDPALFDRFQEMARDLARRLPQDETALTALLIDRLLPYLDRFVHFEHTPVRHQCDTVRSESLCHEGGR